MSIAKKITHTDSQNELNTIQIIKELKNNFEFLKSKIVISEKELSIILGTGYSVSSLEKMRQNGRALVAYIQPVEGGRILYIAAYLFEYICDITIANKVEFILTEINKITKNFIFSELQIANLLGITASTAANYRKNHIFDEILAGKKYRKHKFAKWIIKNAIRAS